MEPIERSNFGICLIQDDVFKFVDTRCAVLFRCTIDELLGTNLQKVVCEEDLFVIKEHLRKTLMCKKGAGYLTCKMAVKGPSTRKVEVSSLRVTYRGRPAVMGRVLDITDLCRAEEIVRRYEK